MESTMDTGATSQLSGITMLPEAFFGTVVNASPGFRYAVFEAMYLKQLRREFEDGIEDYLTAAAKRMACSLQTGGLRQAPKPGQPSTTRYIRQ